MHIKETSHWISILDRFETSDRNVNNSVQINMSFLFSWTVPKTRQDNRGWGMCAGDVLYLPPLSSRSLHGTSFHCHNQLKSNIISLVSLRIIYKNSILSMKYCQLLFDRFYGLFDFFWSMNRHCVMWWCIYNILERTSLWTQA